MSIQRIYTTENLKENNDIFIKDDNLHYMKNVMRLKINDEILLFNEKDGEWLSQIKNFSKKEAIITTLKQTRPNNDEQLNDVELIFASIRHSRQDTLIEKATELGVKTLTPITSEYTNIKSVNLDRIKTISFLIGPEGGFSTNEFELLSKTPAIGISLGKLILRSETAGIAILSLYNLG